MPLPRLRNAIGRQALVLIQSRYQHTGDDVSVDGAGFPVEKQAAQTRFRGWIQPAPPQKRVRQAVVTATEDEALAVVSHILFAPIGLTAHKGDRIRREPDNHRRYTLASEPEDAAGIGHHLEADLIEYVFREGAA